jgi:hypothetical protein
MERAIRYQRIKLNREVCLPQDVASTVEVFSIWAIPVHWHNLDLIHSRTKLDVMKQAWQRLFVKEQTHDKFNMSTTLVMILLFLTFWGVSFYVLVNSLA